MRPIAEELDRLVDGIEASTGYRPTPAASASTDELENLEAVLGVPFRPQLRELYLASDGGIQRPVMEYSPLEFLQESTEFARAEMTFGDDEYAVRARTLMDTTRLIALSVGGGDLWIVSPDDPDERVYVLGCTAWRFGLIAHGWRALTAMHADLAEQGYIGVEDITYDPILTWRMVGEGRETSEAIYVPATHAELSAKYQVELMP